MTPTLPPKRWSLTHQLSLGVAALTLFGLSLIFVLIYSMTAYHLAQQQEQSLQSMSQLVLHLLSEKKDSHHDSTPLQGVDDHLAGHNDISLIIFNESQQIFYQTKRQIVLANTRTFKLSGDFAGYEAQIALDKAPDEELLQQLALTLSLSSILGATIFARGGRVLIRRGLRPLGNLILQIKELQAIDFCQRLDGTGQPEEMQPLVDQFNAVLQRIEQAYRQLEGFSANVAHELNTPLSTLMTSTEVALRKQRNPVALYDLLGSNLEELQRISSIIKDMLFLAQANSGVAARREPVASLRSLAQTVVDYHEAWLEEANLHVQLQGDGTGIFDPPLLKRAISNLLSNAIRHATRNSPIIITIALQKNLTLTVSNQGEPIAPEHLSCIFNRFYHASPLRTDSDSHHGLGLGIVTAVARMHGGKPFAYCDAEGTHIGITLRII